MSRKELINYLSEAGRLGFDGLVFLEEEHVLTANPFFLNWVGLSLDELRQSFFDLFEPSTATRFRQRDFYSERESLDSLFKSGKRIGRRFEVVGKCEQLEGTEVRMLSFRADSDKWEAEKNLQQQNLLFESVVRAIPDAVVITDMNDRILVCNQAFTRIFNYPPHAVLGKHLAMMFPEQALPKGGKDEKRVVQTTMLTGTGQRLTAEITHCRLRDPHGACVGYMDIMRDVTRRNMLENHLRRTQKMDAMGQMATGVAHDFNNIINAMLGFAEMLEEDYKQDQALVATVGEIKKAGRSGAALTQQLLTFSRNQDIHAGVYSLNKLIHHFSKVLNSLAGPGVSVYLNTKAEPDRIRADKVQIEQLLLNLCANARDAVNRNGKVVVHTDNIIFNGRGNEPPAGKYIRLAVEDNGSGMDKATLEHIFEPFFTTKSEGKGTGMGLATVYGIVKQAGGFIKVTSQPGQGTTFSFYFPSHEDR